MRTELKLALAAALVVAIAAPALANDEAGKLGPQLTWDAARDGSPRSYMLNGIKLTFTSAKDADKNIIPVLTLNAPGVAPVAVKGQSGFDHAIASFGVAKIDPKNSGLQVIFTSYSGGAHCCTNVLVLEAVNGEWKTIDLGSWDGEGLAGIPRDEDGDGTADLVFYDNAFLYTFDSYAGSWAPPLIMNVVDGKATNVSTAPRYIPLYRADMEKAKAECAKHANGACAAYVAEAARIGEFDLGWAFMLANYDPKSDWDYPGRCDGKVVDYVCKGTTIKSKNYPESLHWFLEDNGYIKKP